MFSIIREVLTKLEDNGYEAYIVGGYVRDYIMNIKSSDIDICTNAKPKDTFDIFKEYAAASDEYGCVSIRYKNIHFEITTYRKDIKYDEKRKPIQLEYVDSLAQDVQRRDLTINALCMDKDGQIIDLLGGRRDIESKLIKVVGNPFHKLKEDPLRTMRVIRFATKLGFKIDKDTEKAVIKYARLVKKLSYQRKLEELIKILVSSDIRYGIELLTKYKLDKYLEIQGINDITLTNDILGIFSQLNIENIYPLSKNQKDQILEVKRIKETDILDSYNLYKRGPYLSSVAGAIKGIDSVVIKQKYEDLPIKTTADINFESEEICSLLNKTPGSWMKDVISAIEREIVYGKLTNEYEAIKNFVIDMGVQYD